MIRTTHALPLALSLALCSCATTAPKQQFSEVATDDAGSDQAWARLDTDKDGTLSQSEIENQQMVALQEDSPNADANHDGRVSRAEWNAWWPRMTVTPAPASLARLNVSSAH